MMEMNLSEEEHGITQEDENEASLSYLQITSESVNGTTFEDSKSSTFHVAQVFSQFPLFPTPSPHIFEEDISEECRIGDNSHPFDTVEEELQPYNDSGPLSCGLKSITREITLENLESNSSREKDNKRFDDYSVPLVAVKEFRQIMLSERSMFQQQLETTQKLYLGRISDLKEDILSLRHELDLQRNRIDRLLEGRSMPGGDISAISDELTSLRDKVLRLTKCINEDSSTVNDEDFRGDCECSVCIENFPRIQIVQMPAECKHFLCTQCFVTNFDVVVKSKSVTCFCCPVCNKPEIPPSNFPSFIQDYFRDLSKLIMKHSSRATHQLFEKKLTESCVLNIPGVKLTYCPTCKEAFTKDRMDCLITKCPKCHQCMCPHCNRTVNKDDQACPNEQCVRSAESESKKLESASVQTFINNTMISCPSCYTQFTLDPTGCDHLQCSQCQHEFCRCCGQPYKHGRNCTALPSCERKGLHAHHPRNCFYFLRDLPFDWLEKMLTVNDKPFGQLLGVLTDSESSKGLCVWGKDSIQCERKTEGKSNLCSFHYTDYLVTRIRSENLDPAEAFDTEELKNVLTREGLTPPKKRLFKSALQYQLELLEYVKTQLPLEKSASLVHPQKSNCVVM